MSEPTAERPSFYQRWLSPDGHLGLHLLLGLLVLLATALAFDFITDKVFSTHDIRLADAQAQVVARRLMSPRMTAIMQTISMLGSLPALVSLSLAVIAWLLKVKSHRRLYAFVLSVAGGSLVNLLLKHYYHRARPSSPLVLAHGYSFPSGHAMEAVCFFGSLAYVIHFTIERRRWLRTAAVLACGLAVLAIGASRIYLGVHYFTDVVAGYVAGLFWMAACFTAVEAWTRWRDYRCARSNAVSKTAATTAGVLLLAALAGPPAEAASPAAAPGAECLAWDASGVEE